MDQARVSKLIRFRIHRNGYNCAAYKFQNPAVLCVIDIAGNWQSFVKKYGRKCEKPGRIGLANAMAQNYMMLMQVHGKL